jgi:hypothetical protein|eukprot:2984238-Prymnesium_polylepis.1
MEQELWYFQRSCPAITAIVSNLQKVQEGLPSVVSALRAHAIHLSSACVAPERSDYAQNPGAEAVLGKAKVEHNVQIWKTVSG